MTGKDPLIGPELGSAASEALPKFDPSELPSAAVEELGGGLKMLTFPDGFRCYTHSSVGEAALIYHEIFVKQEYIGDERISLSDCRCLVDVGANIGLFTVFAKLRNPDLTVYAFEPIKPTYDVLRKNVELHGLTDVHTFNCALGAEDGLQREITFYPNAAGNSTSDPGSKEKLKRILRNDIGSELTDHLFASPEVHRVTCRTLTAVLEEEGVGAVDLLKVDTEGDEMAILRGISEPLFARIRRIVGEIHSDALLADVQTLLAGKGFQVFADRGLTGRADNSNLIAVRE